MNFVSVVACRVYQKFAQVVVKCLRMRKPFIYQDSNAIEYIPDILEKQRRFHPLIVTDPGLKALDLDKKITEVLKRHKISYSLYSDVVPNPTFSCIEAGYKVYKTNNCDCLIALGGGSSLDAAKAIGVRVVRPSGDLSKYKGILKVKKSIPLLIAIPTTAGTGSEATAACVVVNDKTHDKFSINDAVLIPHYAILDDSFLEALPPSVIGKTGMDALTHAVESYINISPIGKSREYALEALALIKNNLVEFYKDPKNQTARINMQKAAYLAGVSFTRGYIGYAHALGHALGGKYNVQHGLAVSVLLPYCLEAYGKKAHKRLAEIADYLGFTSSSQSREEKAKVTIDWIKELNSQVGIPEKILNVVKDEDYLELSTHAAKEANPLYPVPCELNASELETILLLACK